ncbi:unnamed protein product [Paramecium sonneborni]|uniref:Uncharacterized protein n=1 Tax=Paramecium sonneborni TaxID=65129 RepID=A0A8S1N586_9CILI|nr:unnamed protein product [Paramecium sonneborni]
MINLMRKLIYIQLSPAFVETSYQSQIDLIKIFSKNLLSILHFIKDKLIVQIYKKRAKRIPQQLFSFQVIIQVLQEEVFNMQ